MLNAMPAWTPGKQGGQPVRVKYTVPISLRLDGKAKETPTATGTFTPKESAKSTSLNELVKKLPGAKIDENGNLTVNGKPVRKIVVDGKTVTIQELPKVVDAKKATTLETDDLIISTKEK